MNPRLKEKELAHLLLSFNSTNTTTKVEMLLFINILDIFFKICTVGDQAADAHGQHGRWCIIKIDV
jgi:hypothetical protein